MRDGDAARILGVLAARGVATPAELQAALGKSQPTLSRAMVGLSAHVLTLGRGRATRYALPKSIHHLPAQQPVHWTDESGVARRIGTLSLLAGDRVHVDTSLVASTTAGALPWYLSPLAAQGFLGRLLAQRLAGFGVGPAPER